ncbi:MAG: hypothetical protein RL709_643 [Pseudomonadota bacterium]|jgi:hypothetical protein
MTTLTLDEATQLVPAIGAQAPSEKVSNSYQFVSTRDILNRVQEDGWRITNATSQNRSAYAQHRVTLVHEKDLATYNPSDEGISRIEMFNSHDRSKRLMFAIGFFRFVCSNGLIVASGPAETIRIKHRFSGDRLSEIMEQVSHISSKFPVIQNTIGDFKSRTLTEEEQVIFAQYAIKGRFVYRPEMPKRFRDMGRTVEKLLQHRRDADAGNSTWEVYNRVQENIINGIDGFSRPIKGYSDNVRVNQLLWKGAETTLRFDKQQLNKALMDLIVKDGKKGKISV